MKANYSKNKLNETELLYKNETRMWADAQRDVTLPNIGGALRSTPQSLADVHCWSTVSNTAKMQNPLKLAGVPQTNGPISAASRLKFNCCS